MFRRAFLPFAAALFAAHDTEIAPALRRLGYRPDGAGEQSCSRGGIASREQQSEMIERLGLRVLAIEFLPGRERTRVAISICLAAGFAVGLAFLLNVV